jgi:dynein heavy chain 1
MVTAADYSAQRKGEIPGSWIAYTVRKDTTLSQWLPDLSRRLEQLEAYAQGGLTSTNMGLLFHPSAYITATRQATAQKNGWSLETLRMRIDLGRTEHEGGFSITGQSDDGSRLGILDSSADTKHIAYNTTGLQLEGGEISDGLLSLNNGSATDIPQSSIIWERKGERVVNQVSSVDLPLYINGERRTLLATIEVGLSARLNRVKVIQRGCCLKAST